MPKGCIMAFKQPSQAIIERLRNEPVFIVLHQNGEAWEDELTYSQAVIEANCRNEEEETDYNRAGHFKVMASKKAIKSAFRRLARSNG
jgi:hypothetical protein